MKIAPLADVKARLSAYVAECETSGPVVITRNGKAVAVLLAPENDEDLERLILGHSHRFQAFLDRSWKKIEQGKGLSSEEFWRIVEEKAKKKAAKSQQRTKTATS